MRGEAPRRASGAAPGAMRREAPDGAGAREPVGAQAALGAGAALAGGRGRRRRQRRRGRHPRPRGRRAAPPRRRVLGGAQAARRRPGPGSGRGGGPCAGRCGARQALARKGRQGRLPDAVEEGVAVLPRPRWEEARGAADCGVGRREEGGGEGDGGVRRVGGRPLGGRPRRGPVLRAGGARRVAGRERDLRLLERRRVEGLPRGAAPVRDGGDG